jgi:hypothetical protein
MKIGFYCRACDEYSDTRGKLYTVFDPKLYTVFASDFRAALENCRPPRAKTSLGRDLDPGPLPYQGII